MPEPTHQKVFLRGTALAWARMGVVAAAQLVATPIFLQQWSVERYGSWLLVQAIVGVLTLLANSHQQYVGFELMRAGRERTRLYAAYVGSGLYVADWITLVQAALAVVIAGVMAPMNEVGMVVVLHVAFTFYWANRASIWERVLVANGDYDRVAAWGVAFALVNAAVPLGVLAFSSSFLVVGGVTALVLALVNYFYERSLRKLGLRHLPRALRVRRATAWRNFRRAQGLTLKTILENVRHHGVRLLLAPMVGTAALATFATFRTGANIAAQGVSGVTAPLTPRLMAAARAREQGELVRLTGYFWLFAAAVIGPLMLLLQQCGEPLFTLWTRGKIPFDPLLLGLLSAAVLVNVLSQPAVMLVQGNNLLATQVGGTLAAGLAMVLGFWVLVPLYGIRGGAAGLLIAEIVALGWHGVVAKNWLNSVRLSWPMRPFLWASLAVGGVSLGLVVLPLVTMGGTMLWVLLAAVGLGSWRLFRACQRNGEIPL
jgi:O-antigen/teichoic acid export membrane protein